MQEQAGRIADLVDALLAQLEASHLVGRTESVLDAADHAQRGVLVTFEVQNHVYEMLERARSGDGAVLGDVADQKHRDSTGLGQGGQGAGDGLDLSHAADDPVDVGSKHGLHRVDDDQCRFDLLDVAEDGREIGFGRQIHPFVDRVGAICPKSNLTGRLLARDVQRSIIRAAHRPAVDDLEK